MNIHSQDYLADTPMKVRRDLLAAVELYRNEDTIMLEQAIEAIASGRAVYWTASGYSNARASDLPYELNRGKPILEAIDAAYAGREFLRQQALDTIVPINRKAANALVLAYAKFGSWVDEDELLERRVRDVRRAA
ncbi:hypothetical protein [Aquamicrobium terrae]|uniref:Uncharacterized protein n=1 Tax=Aquamicrobium terrae TaxID=1324945 RepID=A0ABV2MV65_9HYPH